MPVFTRLSQFLKCTMSSFRSLGSLPLHHPHKYHLRWGLGLVVSQEGKTRGPECTLGASALGPSRFLMLSPFTFSPGAYVGPHPAGQSLSLGTTSQTFQSWSHPLGHQLQAHLGDTAGLVAGLGTDHCSKANVSRKRVTCSFWFPSA